MTAILVGCSKRKAESARPARHLYTSPLFGSAWNWAENTGMPKMILSAKHGVIQPDEIIAPYDTYLGQLPKAELTSLTDRVHLQLTATRESEFVVLGGRTYVELVRAAMPEAVVVDPLQGLNIGNRIRWLSLTANSAWHSALDLERMYGTLRRLAGGELSETSLPTLDQLLKTSIPKRGVYFFFERGELRTGRRDLRVTRVGTHAVSRGASSNLRGRLRTHAGTEALAGSHRSSIFRLHVGGALLSRTGTELDTWGTNSGKVADGATRLAEASTEQLVSQTLRGMRALVVAVSDLPSAQSDRAYVERNAIGLLSSAGRLIDPPSSGWLGLSSRRQEIRESGLWNLDHLGFDPYDEFVSVLDQYVASDVTEDGPSRASDGWWLSGKRLY